MECWETDFIVDCTYIPTINNTRFIPIRKRNDRINIETKTIQKHFPTKYNVGIGRRINDIPRRYMNSDACRILDLKSTPDDLCLE